MGYVRIVFIVAALAIFFIKYLMSGTEKKAAIKDGVILLKMNKIYGVIGSIIIVGSLAIMIISTLGIEGFNKEIGITIGFSIFFFVMGTVLLLFSTNVQILADEEKVIHYNILRRKKQIMWKDIRRIIFDKRSLELILDDGELRIKIHIHTVGFFSFVKLMKSKLDYNIYKEAVSIIDTYKKRY